LTNRRNLTQSTSSIYDTIAIITASAVPIYLPISTAITYWLADAIGTQEISNRTLSTNASIPWRTSTVGWIDCWKSAATVRADGISSVAYFTNSYISVELLTLLVDYTADTLNIENISAWTLNTIPISPVLASKIIIN
jgi:hypothetical protein